MANGYDSEAGCETRRADRQPRGAKAAPVTFFAVIDEWLKSIVEPAKETELTARPAAATVVDDDVEDDVIHRGPPKSRRESSLSPVV